MAISKDNEPQDQVSGVVERVTFHSNESGFAVVRVKVQGQRALTTVIGTVANVNEGEWLEAHGRWIVDPKFGRQLKARVLRTMPPHTPAGMERYLASGLIKGIGPSFAGKLVEAFGAEVFDVIEHSPHRLLGVEGIGPKRKKRIIRAWAEQKAVRDIMVFLYGHGVGTNRAFRIYKTYGDDAISKVRENPYRLVRDIWGIGFEIADKIADSLGIARDSPLRARAGLEYVLGLCTSEGHCAFPQEQLLEKTKVLLAVDLEVVKTALECQLDERHLVCRENNDGIPLIFLAALDAAERHLAQNLVELMRESHPLRNVKIASALDKIEGRLGFELAPAQREALEQALVNKVLVITGGPGVGKTTLVNAIVQLFADRGLKTVLCAPTGRAARRMTETSRHEAKTIHRLLEFEPKTGGFKRNRENRLRGDVFVVDETSMIDLTLAHQLLRAIPDKAALILVGDVNQLPSVGPGTVLRHIIDSETVPVCWLTEIFRQAARSAIISNAHRVNNGSLPEWPEGRLRDPASTDFYFVEAESPNRGVELITQLLQERIPRRFGFTGLDDVQVLTPMHKGELGARNLNQVLQGILNPSGAEVQRYGFTFRQGDKVMQMVNNYEKDVFNGDIGRIVAISSDDQEVEVDFDERKLTYSFGELDELSLSYATTIHKSQGSEYPCVIIPVHTQHYVMLQRNLLYTGITRGRKLVVLVGTKRAVRIAVERVDSRKRIGLLRMRLQLEATKTGPPIGKPASVTQCRAS